MLKQVFWYGISFCLVLACQQKSSSNLAKSSLIHANFDTEQIQGLDSVLEFFLSEVSRITGKTNNEDGLNVYLEGIRQRALKGEVELGLAPERHDDFLTNLSPMVRDAIWEPGFMIQDRLVDGIKITDTIQVLNLRLGGKYMLFLQGLARENQKIKFYVESFSSSGDISPALFGDVMQNYREYNLKDPQVQLVFAVHYLTIQDHYLQMQAAKNNVR